MKDSAIDANHAPHAAHAAIRRNASSSSGKATTTVLSSSRMRSVSCADKINNFDNSFKMPRSHSQPKKTTMRAHQIMAALSLRLEQLQLDNDGSERPRGQTTSTSAHLVWQALCLMYVPTVICGDPQLIRRVVRQLSDRQSLPHAHSPKRSRDVQHAEADVSIPDALDWRQHIGGSA